jgi:hypothetical protein
VLDAFIIDELKRREVEERDDAGRPRLEIPDPGDAPTDDDKERPKDSDDEDDDEKKDRGVVVIDL